MTAARSLALRQRVFVDSSGYLVLLDRRDDHHQQAVTVLAGLATRRARQFTASTVIIEAHALILSALGIAASAQFLRDVQAGNTVIVRSTVGDEERAQALLFQYDDKRFSFTDAISFVVMERLGITHAFTFDRNFVQYGFTVLT